MTEYRYDIADLEEAVKQSEADDRQAMQLTELLIKEVSGVRNPASAPPGFAVIKDAGYAGEITQMDVDGCVTYLCGILDPDRTGLALPEKVRLAAQTVVDFVRSAIPDPIVKDKTCPNEPGAERCCKNSDGSPKDGHVTKTSVDPKADYATFLSKAVRASLAKAALNKSADADDFLGFGSVRRMRAG